MYCAQAMVIMSSRLARTASGTCITAARMNFKFGPHTCVAYVYIKPGLHLSRAWFCILFVLFVGWATLHPKGPNGMYVLRLAGLVGFIAPSH